MSDILTDIADSAEALCDPHQHVEPRWEWDANRNKKPLKPWKTTVPGLIQQLRDMAEPGNDGEDGGHGGPESVPVAIDAVSLLAAIAFGAKYRAQRWGLDLTHRPTVEDHLRGLVGAASRRSSDDQRVFRSEILSWTWQAEIITGWRCPPRQLRAPCPHCDANGTLLAHPDPAAPTARCVGCGEKWDAESIGILARHVLAYRERTDAVRAAARTRAVEDRLRREGKTVHRDAA